MILIPGMGAWHLSNSLSLIVVHIASAAAVATCYHPPTQAGQNGSVQTSYYTSCNSMYFYRFYPAVDLGFQDLLNLPKFDRLLKSIHRGAKQLLILILSQSIKKPRCAAAKHKSAMPRLISVFLTDSAKMMGILTTAI
jgi:hypothetical protein